MRLVPMKPKGIRGYHLPGQATATLTLQGHCVRSSGFLRASPPQHHLDQLQMGFIHVPSVTRYCESKGTSASELDVGKIKGN